MKILKKKAIRITLTMLILLLLYILNRSIILNNFSVSNVKLYLESKGAMAPLIYILIFTIVPLTLFPDAFLVIAAGTVFGFSYGTIYTIIGAGCGATLSFYVARLLGHNIFYTQKNPLFNFDERMSGKGFIIIFILRLIPLFPFDLISYSAGLSKVLYRDFITATIIGALPGILVYVNIGDKILDIGSSSFYLSIAVLLILIVLSVILKNSKYFKSLIGSKVQSK